ncbi:unnamed protein product, partial [marine sediment metagenome]
YFTSALFEIKLPTDYCPLPAFLISACTEY